MGLREYTAGLDELERGLQAESGLTRSLSVAAEKNPDEEARAQELSRRTGVPADWIPEFKGEASRRSLLNSPRVRELPRSFPKATSWLSNPENARVAHDDIETLSGIEGIVDMMGREVPDLGGAPAAFARGLKAAPSRLSAGLAETGDILFTPFLREGARLTGSELLGNLARAPRIATDYWRGEADRIAGVNKPGTVANYAGQIGESIGSSVLSMPFGIAGQGPALAMFGLGSEGDYRKYTDAGYSEPYAALLALSTKAMEGITEKMGLDVLYNPERIAKPAFRVALEFLVGELGGEEINTLWGAAKDKLNLQPDMTIEDVAAQVVDTAIVTIGAAGAQGVTAHVAARASSRLQMNAQASRNRTLMEALGATATDSKLLKRMPEKVREFVDHVTADGPVENVYIPVEEWTTYFQEKGMDPGQVAREILGDRTQYQEAMATGSDLVIPLGRYVEALAGTEHHAGLAQDLRLRQGDMTAREEGTFRKNLSTRMAELIDQGAAEEPGQTPEGASQGTDRKVYDDVLAQLTAAGRAPEAAAREATLTQAVLRTLGKRSGVDPFELYRRYGLKITGAETSARHEFPDISGLSEDIKGSAQWRSLAEDLAEKKYRGKKFEGGVPLLERLGKGGRLLVSPAELRGIQAWENGIMPYFTTKRSGKKGETLKWDVMARSLVEEGYLREDSTTLNDLVEAIQADQKAKKTDGGRLTPGGVTDYEVAREAAKLGYFQDVLLPQGEKERRGYLRFGPDRQFELGLLENADLSTYLHESGHFYLEVLRDLAGGEGADPQLLKDWKTISEHLGIGEMETGKAIPEGAHETFARSFEAYLMEGKAPSPELASAFQRFKAWLIQVYREVSRLGVRLNADVRGVFDRLVATDEEIAAAESEQRRSPIFTTAEAAGMTEAEFAAYRRDIEKAHAVAKDTLERELITEFSLEKKALWSAERERVHAAVEEESKQNAVFQVYHLLTRGELLDGSQPATPIKMSRKVFVEAYGKEFVDRLPPKWFRRMTDKEGMHPDVVAQMFGFTSGDEMIKALLESPHRSDWIEQETDRRMREAHGDALNDGSIAESAIDAVHNDETGKVLRAELRALRRKEALVRPFIDQALRASESQQRDSRREMEASIPPIAAFRAAAEKTIGAKSLMSVRPDLYLRAEEKAARKAFDAAAKGDFGTAATEKKKQLLNHYLYLEARSAREEGDSIYRYVHALMDSPAQERLGKAGEDFLEQVNGILEQYEFKPVSNKAIEERKSLLEWVRQQEEMGIETAIPDVVLYFARAVNYRELTMDRLRAVRDGLKNIEHLARMKNRLLGKQAEVSFGEAVVSLVTSIHENIGPGKPLPIDRETRSVIERLGDKASEFDVSLLKAEQLVEWADGKDIAGPWSEYIFRPISDAQVLEGDLTMRYTKHLAEMFTEYTRDVGPRAMMEKIYIKGLDQSLTRQALVAAALNTGNETSFDKLLRGRGWTEDHLQEVLSHLTKSDWEFVQKTWDAIEELWPDIAALQRRLTGLEPKKVVAREFTNEHGTFRGGYYPAVYDARFSQAGAKQADVTGEHLFEGNYVRATTDKGHTKERTAYVAPILLSLEVIPQHFAQVIHDLSFREAVVQADRLLNQTDVRTSINETMGPAYHRMMKLWLASVANDRNTARTGAEFYNRFMDGLRMNATVVAMGFKATTMIGQALDIIQSLRRVEGKYLGPAILQFTKNPIKAREWVQEKSGEMRHRERNLDRDLRDLGRKIMGKKGVLPWMQEKALHGISIVDMVAAVPTWIGAYNQALGKGLGDADAIAWADRQVRLSNPAGGAKDLAAIQRSGSLMKLFTMFYSYFNVLYNQQRDMARQWRHGEKGFRDVGELAWGSLAVVIIPALAGELLTGRGPDDDEEPAWWVLRKVLLYPFLSVPILKDIVNSLESGRDYQMTPVADAIARVTKAVARSEQVAEGEREPVDLAAPLADVAGYSLGLPSGQAKITGRYIWDLMEGNESPEGPGEFMRNILFTRKKK